MATATCVEAATGTQGDYVPRAQYESLRSECDSLRETLELAIGVAISRAQLARGEGIPHAEAMRRVREGLIRRSVMG